MQKRYSSAPRTGFDLTTVRVNAEELKRKRVYLLSVTATAMLGLQHERQCIDALARYISTRAQAHVCIPVYAIRD